MLGHIFEKAIDKKLTMAGIVIPLLIVPSTFTLTSQSNGKHPMNQF